MADGDENIVFSRMEMLGEKRHAMGKVSSFSFVETSLLPRVSSSLWSMNVVVVYVWEEGKGWAKQTQVAKKEARA